MADITAIILTKNEEINIEDCIKSVIKIAKRVIVMDSFSTDNTVELAKKCGAEVYQNKFITHSKQFKHAIEIAKINTKWVLRIDADERLTEQSATELNEVCNENNDTDVNGIIVRFKKNFLGKDLYHGGVYPWKKLICYKYGKADIEDRSMDEHIVLLEGRTIELKHDSLHLDFKSLEAWIAKHNWYSSKEASDYYNTNNNHENNNIKTIIKTQVYYKLPMKIRSHIYYFYRYYIRLGFLDGKEGQIYAFLQAYWYRYLVDAKIFETQKTGIKYEGKGELK